MRERSLRRRLPAALVLGLYWFALTASVEVPRLLLPAPRAPPLVVARRVTPAPVSCVGTLFDLRTTSLRLGGRLKVIIMLDVTRADRCAGPYGQPVGRLQTFLVFTRDRLALRTTLRTGQPNYWLQLCRRARPQCVDFEGVLRWSSAAADTR